MTHVTARTRVLSFLSVATLALAATGCEPAASPAPAARPAKIQPAQPAAPAPAVGKAEAVAKAPAPAAQPAAPAAQPAAAAASAAPADAPAGEAPVKGAAKPGEVASDSVYQVTSSWKDQAAKPRRLRDLRGKVVVMSMVFTHCRYACPRIVADMQKIERGLKGKPGADNVRFVLVSMDPERDTPKRLTEFAAKHKLDLSRWSLLTGPEGDVRVLSAVLGGRYKQAPSGDFAHSNLVCVLDQAGRIVHRQEGLEIAPEGALAAIAKLQQ